MDKDALLKERFDKAVMIASQMPPLPPDIMLSFYAYFKHATKSDRFGFNTKIEKEDLKSSFKFNALTQLRGICPKKAKKEYIKLVEEHTNQTIL